MPPTSGRWLKPELNSKINDHQSYQASTNFIYLPLITNLQLQAPPLTPAGWSAFSISPTGIQLDWIDMSRNEDGFIIYDGAIFVADVPSDTTSYRVYGMAPGSYHCFHIHAYNSYGSSSWTDWTCTTTPATDDPDDLRWIEWSETLYGTINEPWDEDVYFSHGLSWYGMVRIEVSTTDTEFDPYLIVYGPDGNVMDMNDDDICSTNSAVNVRTIWADNGYRIVVRGSGFASSGTYKLKIDLME